MLTEGPVIHYCSQKSLEKSNGAYLMGAFLVLVLKQSPKQAWENFQNLPLFLLSYRDAGPGLCSYKCSILHCLQALYKSLKFDWVNYPRFDIKEYKNLYSIEKGDITWIVPHKIAVFSSPCSEPRDYKGLKNYTPEDYSAIFNRIGIKTVIKLDGPAYDGERFVRNGMKYYDLSFKGSLPPINVANAFLDITEESGLGVAVHCKSGLGKSPTLVGLYVMKKFDISAEDYIAWARICRPGSIIGQQQEYIKQMETKSKALKKKDEVSSKRNTNRENTIMRKKKITVSSKSALDLRGSMKPFNIDRPGNFMSPTSRFGDMSRNLMSPNSRLGSISRNLISPTNRFGFPNKNLSAFSRSSISSGADKLL
jgi:cell division cycle 14